MTLDKYLADKGLRIKKQLALKIGYQLANKYRDEFKTNPQGILGTVKSGPWNLDSSVCLLGDAAHGIVPFFGQGMNSGFEDCSLLINILEKKIPFMCDFFASSSTYVAKAE